jgi:hypothetical protein
VTDRLRHPSAALGIVLCLALAAAACAPSNKAASSTTTSVPPLTTTTRAGAPAGTTVPSGFEPGSVTFVSSTTGFVIGVDSSCAAGACVALARTTDRGLGWVALPAPDAGYEARNYQGSTTAVPVSEVRFADDLDGWIYGPSLFATHDGGTTWQEVSLGGSVISLETSGGYVDALVSPCTGVQGQECTGPLRLYQAQATGGGFSLVLTGPPVSSTSGVVLHLSLHAPVGFVNMSGVGGPGQAFISATRNLADTSGWKAFPDPCATSTDDGFDALVAPDTTSLYTLCSGQGAAGSVIKAVVRTVSGVSTVTGGPPAGGDPEALAATSAGTLVVSAASGASWLYRSTDGGATWTTAETFDDGGIGFNDLGFTTSTQGVVIHGVPGPPTNVASQLLMTTDGGASWSAVPIG